MQKRKIIGILYNLSNNIAFTARMSIYKMYEEHWAQQDVFREVIKEYFDTPPEDIAKLIRSEYVIDIIDLDR